MLEQTCMFGQRAGMDHVALGQRLRAAREAKNVTQEDLAHAIGKTRLTVANIELGLTASPKLDTIADLATTLGVHLEWLVNGADVEPRADPGDPRDAILAAGIRFFDVSPEDAGFIRRAVFGTAGGLDQSNILSLCSQFARRFPSTPMNQLAPTVPHEELAEAVGAGPAPESSVERSLPIALQDFLATKVGQTVTANEQESLLQMAASDGRPDYAAKLAELRDPTAGLAFPKTGREPEATKVELPEGVMRLKPRKPRG
jgi:transcriptional regulator with XRE-family HTH domain